MESPDAREEFSTLGGTALLVLEDDGSVQEPASRKVSEALRQLPCPTLLCPTESHAVLEANRREYFPHIDVVLDDRKALPNIVDNAGAAPLAALTTVQLLRHSRARSIPEGLFAESLAYGILQAGPEFASWRKRTPLMNKAIVSDGPPVLVSREQSVLRLVFNRPEIRNAFSYAARDALVEALQLPLLDDSIERIEFSAVGSSFCSGGHLDEFGSLSDAVSAHATRTTRSAGAELNRSRERAFARVHGACIGAGVDLPSFCGHVTAARETFFQLPEIAMGLCPGAGGTASIPARIGRERTTYMALSAERIDTERALAWGLIDKLED